jgi:phage anti-repressor protein
VITLDCVIEMANGEPYVVIVKDRQAAIDLAVDIAMENDDVKGELPRNQEDRIRKEIEENELYSIATYDWSVWVTTAKDESN